MIRFVGKWVCVVAAGAAFWQCAATPAITGGRSTTGNYNEYSEDLSAARPVYSTTAPPPAARPAPAADTPRRPTREVPLTEALHVNRRLDAVLDTLATQNRRVRYAPGYRVQVYVGNERAAADALKLQLYQQFPELSAYMSYQQPTYRLKVGDFMRRMDAERYFSRLKQVFATAQMQPDRVDLRRSLLIK